MKRQKVVGFVSTCRRGDTEGIGACSVCGQYLKDGWLSHLTPLIMNVETVDFVIVSRQDWPNIYHRMHRAGTEFARVELADGSLAVFITAAEGTPLPRSIWAGVPKVAINPATFSHKAITTFTCTVPKEEGEESEWGRVGGLSITV